MKKALRVFLLLCLPIHLLAQGNYVLSGVVFGKKEGKPEKDVYVAVYEVHEESGGMRYEIPSATYSLFTGEDGAFSVELQGRLAYQLEFAKVGYEIQTLKINKKENADGKRVGIEVQLKAGYDGSILSEQFIDAETKQPLANVHVTLTALDGNTSKICPTDSQGRYYFTILSNGHYVLNAYRSGYFHYATDTLRLSADKKPSYSRVLPLQAIAFGQWTRMADFGYAVNTSDLTKQGRLELDKLYRIMHDNPNVFVKIACHTDARGDDAYNLQLSQVRAQKAVAYLVEKGIEAGRLSSEGYGETQLLNECGNGVRCEASKHLQNRRLEYAFFGE